MSYVNTDLFLFLSNVDIFFYSCLISLARISNATVTKTVKCKHPCLIPYLKWEAFILLPLTVMLGMAFKEMSFIRLVRFLSILVVECFYCNNLGLEIRSVGQYLLLTPTNLKNLKIEKLLYE